MSQFTSGFWDFYIAGLTLISVLACGVLLKLQSSRKVSGGSTETTGHTWDEDLGEYNNPLPKWWMWLFYITIVFGLAYLFGDRITQVIQSAERGFTAVMIAVALVALAVVAFFSFRKRRIRMLDHDPEALFERREILLGPAADRIADAVALGDVNHDEDPPSNPTP